MPETIELPKEEVFDLIDDLDPIERENWRHGTRDTYVFPKSGAYWRVVIDNHHEEGLEIYGDTVTAMRVFAHPVVKDEWKTTPPKMLVQRQGDAARFAVELTEKCRTADEAAVVANAWSVAADAAEEAGAHEPAEAHRRRAEEWRKWSGPVQTVLSNSHVQKETE